MDNLCEEDSRLVGGMYLSKTDDVEDLWMSARIYHKVVLVHFKFWCYDWNFEGMFQNFEVMIQILR